MIGTEAVAAVIDALTGLGVPYRIVGSFSSNHYGIPRSTQDADFVVVLEDVSIMQVARKLSPTIRVDPPLSFETFSMRCRFEATVEGDCFKIELSFRHDDPYDLIRFERRRPRPFLGRQAFVPTPEDVIVQKLRWARSKDLDDARDVIAVQGDDALDWEYIHSWCDRHGSRDRLDAIRRSIPPM